MVGLGDWEKDQNNRTVKTEEGDRLCDLPLDILNIILLKLPLKEAIRTSILSKHWRQKWVCLSQFKLDLSGMCGYASGVVDVYLDNHDDAIVKFQLSGFSLSREDLDTWIDVLSTKGVKELVIDENQYRVELPFSLFACKQLQHLKLDGFTIKVPMEFKGFNYLTTLILTNVSIDDEELEILIQECRALEILKLSLGWGMADMRICGANLKYIELGMAENIRFQNTKSLASIHCFRDNSLFGSLNGFVDIVCNLFTADGGLSNLESLSVHIEVFLLSAPIIAKEKEGFPLKHHRLSELNLYGSLDLSQEDSDFLSVLGRFPNLKKLNFSVGCYDPRVKSQNVSEVLKPLNLNRLAAVIVEYDFCPLRVLANFLKVIIGNSPLLQTLEITKLVEGWRYFNKNGKTTRIRKRLWNIFSWLKEASCNAKIIHKARFE